MQYLKIKKDKALINKEKGKYKEIYEGQLFTLKEFYKLMQAFYTLSMEDAYIIEVSKKEVVDYYGDGVKYESWNVPLPF